MRLAKHGIGSAKARAVAPKNGIKSGGYDLLVATGLGGLTGVGLGCVAGDRLAQ